MVEVITAASPADRLAAWQSTRQRADLVAVAVNGQAGRPEAAEAPGGVAAGVVAKAVTEAPGRVAAEVLAASSARALVEALTQAGGPAGLLYPPLATPDRLMAQLQAGLGGLDEAVSPWSVRLGGPGPAGAPLWLEGDHLVVDQATLTPLQIEALARRRGLVLAGQPGGDGSPLTGSLSTGRLLTGPANWGGKSAAWARAVEQHVDGFSGRCLAISQAARLGLVFPADVSLDRFEAAQVMNRVDAALDLILPASHILIDDLRSIMNWRDPGAGGAGPELRQLLDSGRMVAVVHHGTAGRDPVSHAAMHPLSPLASDSDQTDNGRRLVDRVRQGLAGLDIPQFVATPELLDVWPQAYWLPVVLMRADFAPAPPWRPGPRPRVIHLPSRRSVKGAGHVERVVEKLDHSGVIESVKLARVPPAAMPQVLRSADVVIDQLLLGAYGGVLVQALAAGRLGVVNMPRAMRQRIPASLPAVQADVTDLEELLVDIAADPERYRPLAEAGPAFARRFHDGSYAASVLERHFLRPE
ncbi:MAG: hypothetical protein LBJ62_08425 [Bifidobacteriaceae bacterium]|nr:hypothetical protein [Bifidobacteriaceae bacterium]